MLEWHGWPVRLRQHSALSMTVSPTPTLYMVYGGYLWFFFTIWYCTHEVFRFFKRSRTKDLPLHATVSPFNDFKVGFGITPTEKLVSFSSVLELNIANNSKMYNGFRWSLTGDTSWLDVCLRSMMPSIVYSCSIRVIKSGTLSISPTRLVSLLA